DIQVGPALAFGEAREEAAGGNGAGRLAADVVDVGEGRFQLALVVVPERQAPGAVVHVLAGGQQFGGQVVVLAQQAGGELAQGDDAGAGQGGDVDDGLRLVALHIGQGVAEDQPALGV